MRALRSTAHAEPGLGRAAQPEPLQHRVTGHTWLTTKPLRKGQFTTSSSEHLTLNELN